MSRHSHSFLVGPLAKPRMSFADVIDASQGVPSVDRRRWCASCTLALSGLAQTFAVEDRLQEADVDDVSIPF
jgi:hypothetical protein